MDPYYEQRLREEVIYLHSLWRRGPPRPNPYPNYGPNLYLHSSSSPQFKRQGEPWKIRNGGVSDIEWPVKPPADTPATTASGWPELKLNSNRSSNLVSAEDQTRFAWNRIQQKALKAAQEFFSRNGDSDEDESDEDMVDEEEEYEFFFNLFEEEKELRGYLEKNFGGGVDFCCLACGGKFGKRFKDCIALVQHSVSVAKMKKRRAHRAYARVVCKVLGWEIDNLPSIVSALASKESQGDAPDDNRGPSSPSKADLQSGDNGEASLESESNVGQSLPNGATETSNALDGEMMVCKDSLREDGGVKNMEDPEKGVANEPVEKTEESSLPMANAIESAVNLDEEVANEAGGSTEGVMPLFSEAVKEDDVECCEDVADDVGKSNVATDGQEEEDYAQS